MYWSIWSRPKSKEVRQQQSVAKPSSMDNKCMSLHNNVYASKFSFRTPNTMHEMEWCSNFSTCTMNRYHWMYTEQCMILHVPLPSWYLMHASILTLDRRAENRCYVAQPWLAAGLWTRWRDEARPEPTRKQKVQQQGRCYRTRLCSSSPQQAHLSPKTYSHQNDWFSYGNV